jgi:hypothetical protein
MFHVPEAARVTDGPMATQPEEGAYIGAGAVVFPEAPVGVQRSDEGDAPLRQHPTTRRDV